jgi:outer membrane protein OmpA-like peptidoglycan-associated protein
VRLDLWAWNAQLGLMAATGGPQSAEGSLMCGQGVNLKLVRQDDATKMREDLVAFASAFRKGEPQPHDGAALVAIMGDGSATFLAETNKVLAALGPGYSAKVVGSTGYSWGEDKFMGPPAWKKSPAASRGGLVAGVVRDGDWNIAQKWLAENRLCNNPDERTWDADCLNWLNTPGYVEAAQAYVAGQCEERAVVSHGKRTGETKRVCVDAVVTWTPGDVTVAKQRGGLVSIVSTREYRGQMPQVLIGLDPWMRANPATVEGLLAAAFEGAERVKADPAARARAAAVSAQVYGEEDGAYWDRYFVGATEADKQGLKVELGGSRVNTLADNLFLFGVREFAPGSTNLFAATYTVFGNIVKAQYPELVPSFPPAAEVVDTSYLEALAHRGQVGSPEVPRFESARPIKEVVSNGSWAIPFESGKATFTRDAQQGLNELFDQLVIAGGTAVEIHGHTDSAGDPRRNLALSEERAFAVKDYLEHRSPANFPAGRIRVFAHGAENPMAPNTNAAGRAQNRRVQIVLGTTQS